MLWILPLIHSTPSSFFTVFGFLWNLPPIEITPSVIFTVFGFPVTNTLLCTWITGLVLVLIFYFGTRKRAMIPGRFQGAVEYLVEILLGLVSSVVGNDRNKAKTFFPFVATLFLFILLANLLDVFPGVDTVGQIAINPNLHTTSKPVLGFLLFGDLSNQLIPWIRPATTDLNLNIAMALITVVSAQVIGFTMLGAGHHLGKYFNFKSPIDFFVGILELVQEVARVISLAFRLFGNIFAGSAVLAIFAFILPVLANIIFIPFEIFVAGVQALIFSLLSLIYLELASESHEQAEEEFEEAEHGQRAGGEPRQTAQVEQGERQVAATR